MNKKLVYLLFVLVLLFLVFFYISVRSGKDAGVVLVSCPTEIESFGETYRVVKIGGKCWMAENLRTTRYLDGGEITRLDREWEGTETGTGVYAIYPNEGVFVNQTTSDEDLVSSPIRYVSIFEKENGREAQEADEEIRNKMTESEVIKKFGMLYNFHAVNNLVGICPEGWSVPTHDDWSALESALCESSTCEKDFPFDTTTMGYRGTDEGSKLAGSSHLWLEGELKDSSVFDASGFEALPGGYRDTTGFFSGQGSSAYFWSVVDAEGGSWIREIHNDRTGVLRQYLESFWGGMSVRCIRNH